MSVRLLLIGLATAQALVLSTTTTQLPTTRARDAFMMAKKTQGKKLVSVLLDNDVSGLGAKGMVVQVKAPYAENVIVRGGLGKVATPTDLERIAAEQAAADAAAVALKQKAEGAKEAIQGKFSQGGMKFEVQPGEVVTSASVAAELLRTTKVTVLEAEIGMSDISECPGSAIAELSLHPEVRMSLKVTIEKSKITFS